MTVNDILRELDERGVQLRAENGDLVVRGSRDALDADLVGLLKANKSALIDLLTTAPSDQVAPLVDLDDAELAAVTATVDGGAANLHDVYPLAPLQEGVLFHHIVAESGDPYVISLGYAFDTRARLDGYLRAFQAVVDRHDILRTGVVWSGVPEPVQVVWKRATLPVEEVPAGPGDPLERLRARFDPRTDRMDLGRAPLLRVYFTHDAPRSRWVMVLFMHHVLGDHTTLDVIHADIEAHLRGAEADLPEPVPFRSFVTQVRSGLSRAQHEGFFTGLLGDIDEPTAPFGLTDVHGDGTGVAEHRVRVDPDVSARLRAACRSRGVSVAAAGHLAWALVLARLTDRADVVFGTVLFGRMAGGDAADRAVGPFITTLPVRLTVDEASVEDGVRAAQTVLAGVLRHEHAPLVLAQRCSAVPAPAPLFTTLLNYRHGAPPAPEQRWEGIEALHGEERTSYPITVSIDDIGTDLYLTAQVIDTIDPDRICRYLETALGALADALADDPAGTLAALDVLPAAETAELTADHSADVPVTRTVHALFGDRVLADPDAVAVSDGAEDLTYRQLDARANQVAHWLLGLGVRPGDHVGVLLGRGVDAVAALLGVLKAGGAYVPLDPAYPAERTQFVREDCLPVALIDAEALAAIPDTTPEHDPGVAVTPSDAAYVIYTSGSTGQPKGVVVEHRNVVRLVASTNHWFGFGPDDVWSWFHSYAFDFSVWEIFGALITGGRIVVVPGEVARSPREFHALVCRAGVTVLNQTPSAFRQFLDAQGEDPRPHRLRHVVLGGEALDVAMLRPWFAREANAGTRVANMYGITETAVHTTYHLVTEADLAAGGSPIGVPIPDLRVYVLDRLGRPVPDGVVGEMWVGGAGVARGYLNRPELTGQRFGADPFVPGDRVYRSGDLAVRHSDGSLRYVGRNDAQVKVRGFRVEPGEIESALSAHDAVRDAVVLLRDGALVAYVIGTADAAELRAHLAARLPEHMVPAAYVRVDEFPLTVNGKLDRAALPAPGGTAFARRGYQPPVGTAETALAEIWADLLDQDLVGRDDNFFDLGGHSLFVVALLDRLGRRGLRLDARVVFTAPVLRDLAEHVRDETERTDVPANVIPSGCERITPELLPLVDLTQSEVDHVVATVRGGAPNLQDVYPLAPLQEGILFHHLVNTDHDPFLLFAVMAMDSRARVDRYIAAVQAVIDRHDLLRTGFVWAGLPEPVQVVWREAPLSVVEVDLDPADGDVAEQLRDRYDARTAGLDVTQAPLMRFYVAEDTANDRWVVLSVAHHLVDDNTTYRLMLGEIAAHILGRQDELPAPLPLRDFVARSRAGVSTEEHQAFFRRVLGDVTEPTLPFGLREVRGHGGDTDVVTRRLAPDLARGLREHARELGVNPASLFHLAWALVVARCADRDQAVFATVLFGRMAGGAGAAGVMGVFINTLPVRVDVGEIGTADSVRATYTQLTELLRHEHAPLALAQRCSAVPPGEPLFSALLNYRYNVSLPGRASGGYAEANAGITMLSARERSNYPLMLGVDDLGVDFDLTVHAQRPVDPDRVLAFVERAVEVLLDALADDPDQPVGSLDILPAAERARVLACWDGPVADVPEVCSHELFEEHARRTPTAVAITAGDRAWTYAEVDTAAARLARGLAVRPDDRVAVCAERGAEQVVALLAVLKAGGAYVPLDPAYPADRLRMMLDDSAPVAVLADQTGRAALGAIDAPVIDLAGTWATGSDVDTVEPGRSTTPDHLAYVVYTSGSTGTPKGVAGEHRALVNRLLWAATALPPAASHAQKTSISFIDAITETLAPLVTGATLDIVPADAAADPAALAAHLGSRGTGRVTLVPSLLSAMLDAVPGPLDVPVVVCSGEALPGALVARLAERSPATRLVNLYGSSEVAGDVTAQDPADGSDAIGRPIANARVAILDRRGRPAPIGVDGEVHVAGTPVARGYLNRPDLTAERFGSDTFGRAYRTGDRGRLREDGAIVYTGRADRQVKVRGFRVEPGEIESRLREVVRDAFVHADGDRLIAHYAADEPVAADDLRTHLAATLPTHLVPAAYVHYPEFPRTPSGKLDPLGLRDPDAAAYASRAYVPPAGAVQTAIAQVWADLLGVELVGGHDRFVDLGGHSLLAVRAVNRLRAAGVTVPVADLFGDLTLAGIADRVVAGDTRLGERDATPLRPGGASRPLFLVHDGAASLLYATSFAGHLDEDLPVYGLPPVPLGDPELTTVEGMAARMVRMIRAVQPEGPYRVAGWCTGGAIAYEIATQLLGADEPVEFVGLLNTTYWPPERTPVAAEPDPRAEVIAWLDTAESDLPFADLVECAREAGVLPTPLVDLTSDEVALAIRRKHLVEVASARYVPTPIPGPVHYFSAVEHDPANPLGKWDEALPGVDWRRVAVPRTHQSMMRLPDVREVGAVVSAAVSAGTPVSAARTAALTTLRTGDPGAAPLLCLPGAGATVVGFHALIGELPAAMPVYGLQPRGVDSDHLAHATVEAAAAAHLAEIGHLTAAGPVHLLGHSFGGWQAYELACAITARGGQVASLSLLDCEPPATVDAVVEVRDLDALLDLVALYGDLAGTPLGLHRADLAPLGDTERRVLLHARMAEVGLVPPKSPPDLIAGPVRTFTRCLRTTYAPRGTYAGPVGLVLVDDAAKDADANRADHQELLRGWRRLAPAVELWRGPGTHMTMLAAPHVAAIADHLTRTGLTC